MLKVEKPELPMFRLERICFNCKYYRRRQPNLWSRYGLCRLIEITSPEIKVLPRKERRAYYTKVPVDAACDFHQFKGHFVEAAATLGARPLT